MRTHYDLMKASTQADTDNELYPDVLSLNYQKLLATATWKPWLKVTTDEYFKTKPYLKVWQYYKALDTSNQAELDDIILDMNNIKHVAEMLDEDTVYFPDPTDMNSFYANNKQDNT